MLADRDEQTARLRRLHDDYVWKVNAAVAEGRDDLIRRLCDEYVEDAVRMLAEDAGTVRPGAVPADPRPGAARPAGRSRGWWRTLLGGPGGPPRRRRG